MTKLNSRQGAFFLNGSHKVFAQFGFGSKCIFQAFLFKSQFLGFSRCLFLLHTFSFTHAFSFAHASFFVIMGFKPFWLFNFIIIHIIGNLMNGFFWIGCFWHDTKFFNGPKHFCICFIWIFYPILDICYKLFLADTFC